MSQAPLIIKITHWLPSDRMVYNDTSMQFAIRFLLNNFVGVGYSKLTIRNPVQALLSSYATAAEASQGRICRWHYDGEHPDRNDNSAHWLLCWSNGRMTEFFDVSAQYPVPALAPGSLVMWDNHQLQHRMPAANQLVPDDTRWFMRARPGEANVHQILNNHKGVYP